MHYTQRCYLSSIHSWLENRGNSLVKKVRAQFKFTQLLVVAGLFQWKRNGSEDWFGLDCVYAVQLSAELVQQLGYDGVFMGQ